MQSYRLHYRNLHCQLVGYKNPATRHPKILPQLNNPNTTSEPDPLQQVTANVNPIAQRAFPTSPTSSSSNNPDGLENDEGSHPLSTSTSGPATPDGVLTKVEEGGKQQKNSEKAMATAPREAGDTTISPENGALFAEVLKQNTTLRQR